MKVANTVRSSTYSEMPDRYRDSSTRWIPFHALPPITARSTAATAWAPPFVSGCSRVTSQAAPTATHRKAAETRSSAGAPSGRASVLASHGPTIAPMVPPTAIAPNSRLLCSSVKRSAISAQNTIVANRLKTLYQT
jgi:hypothetical protein